MLEIEERFECKVERSRHSPSLCSSYCTFSQDTEASPVDGHLAPAWLGVHVPGERRSRSGAIDLKS